MSRKLLVTRKWVQVGGFHLYYVNESLFGSVADSGRGFVCFVDGVEASGGFASLDLAKEGMFLLSCKSKWRGRSSVCGVCGGSFVQSGVGRPRLRCFSCGVCRAKQTLI